MPVLQGDRVGALQDAPRENTNAQRHDPSTSSGRRCAAINAASAQSDIILQSRTTRPGSFEPFDAVVPPAGPAAFTRTIQADQVETALAFLEHCRKAPRARVSSYTLKHTVERWGSS